MFHENFNNLIKLWFINKQYLYINVDCSSNDISEIATSFFRVWNSLPSYLRRDVRSGQFKRQLKILFCPVIARFLCEGELFIFLKCRS